MSLQQQQSIAYVQFVNALHSEKTKIIYTLAIDAFIKYTKLDYDKILELEPKKVQAIIISYTMEMKQNKKLSPVSMKTYLAAIKTFFEINDYEGINWRKVKRYVGEFYTVGEDRPYTREEIKKLVDAASLRNKAIILLMASSGMRRGALPKLKLKHLKAENKYNIFIIDVYKQAKEHYFTFCTPESRKAIEEYIEWRARLGEKITPESPLFRQDFNTLEARSSIVPITDVVIRGILKRLRVHTNIVQNQPLTENVNAGSQRTKIKTSHGFRKFFDTTATNAGMNPLFIEIIMGHNTGIKAAYYKPTVKEILEGNDRMHGYISIINDLTINEENRLRQQLQTQKQESARYIEICRQIDDIRKEIGLPPLSL